MQNRKIALFMLPPLTQGGGAEKYFINLAKNLSLRDGTSVDVITFDDQSFRRFARLLHAFVLGNFFGKIPDYEKGMREKRENIQKDLGSARWIESPRQNLKNILQKYDVIYAKNEIVDLVLLRMIGYRNLPPVVVGVHTPLVYSSTKSFLEKLHNFLYGGFFYRWLISGVSRMHLSNREAKDFADKNFKIKSDLIYYPFSAEEVQKRAQEIKTEIKFDETKFNIIFVGRLSNQKGIELLVNIVEGLAEKSSVKEKMMLNIFGSGNDFEEGLVKRIAQKYSWVKYYGHVENKFIPSILEKQDLFITTSKWETLPFNVLEAQAVGLPVVTFDIPGPSDIIANNSTGFLVSSEGEFVAKIESFAKGEIVLDKEKIIENIKAKFDPEKIYSQLTELFNKIILRSQKK